MSLPSYQLTLHKSYYEIFNLGVDVERFISADLDGDMEMELEGNVTISAKMTRRANQNETPRVRAGAVLRDWFMKNFREGEVVRVEILAPNRLRINRAGNH